MLQKDDDPQLQKKAYKLIPRLAESESGKEALRERNGELQQLLLASSEKTSAPARRDRLATISHVLTFLPSSDLHFIPSILSEVVISCKEVNEKARTSAYDLLVQMGNKMSEGGLIRHSLVPHMDSNSPDVQASLEEYFTMVSAGLAGSTPHMISASITALTRILFEFHSRLPRPTLDDLVQTLDLFLTSNNREIVRSTLGFVKVVIVSLPTDLVQPRLETLIPNLMIWAHEHKGHFRSKVKHLVERCVRRFGGDMIERLTPEKDRPLVKNIRKTREKKKRRKTAAGEEDGDGEAEEGRPGRRAGKFESEYDNAVYGSSDSDVSADSISADSDSDGATGNNRNRRGSKANAATKGGRSYIHESTDEPLDLLDRSAALAHISSTKPVRFKPDAAAAGGQRKRKAKTDVESGKLVFGDDDGDDAMEVDGGYGNGNGHADGESGANGMEGKSLEEGINAYVDAIKGRDAVKRGQKGRLKFSNKRDDQAEGDGMDVDGGEEEQARAVGKALASGAGGAAGQRSQRKGLGVVGKSGGGGGRGRGGGFGGRGSGPGSGDGRGGDNRGKGKIDSGRVGKNRSPKAGQRKSAHHGRR